VGGCGGEIGVASTPKNAQAVIGRERAIEGKEGGAHVQGFGGKTIYDAGGSGESICPICGRHRGLEK
jgi:hypothetical protein